MDLASLTTPGLRHEERLVNKLKDNLSLAEVSSMINLGDDINGDPVTTLGLDQHNTKLKGSLKCILFCSLIETFRLQSQ